MNIGHSNPNSPTPVLFSDTTPNSWKALWAVHLAPLIYSAVCLDYSKHPVQALGSSSLKSEAALQRGQVEATGRAHEARDLERLVHSQPPRGNMDDAIQSLARAPLLRIKWASLAGL